MEQTLGKAVGIRLVVSCWSSVFLWRFKHVGTSLHLLNVELKLIGAYSIDCLHDVRIISKRQYKIIGDNRIDCVCLVQIFSYRVGVKAFQSLLLQLCYMFLSQVSCAMYHAYKTICALVRAYPILFDGDEQWIVLYELYFVLSLWQ